MKDIRKRHMTDRGDHHDHVHKPEHDHIHHHDCNECNGMSCCALCKEDHAHFCPASLADPCCPPHLLTPKCCPCSRENRKLLDLLQKDLDALTARVIRDEDTIKKNYEYLVDLIGQLAEKEAKDVADLYIEIKKKYDALYDLLQEEIVRATTVENNIINQFNDYVQGNDDALQREIARAKAAEQKLKDDLDAEEARAKAKEQVLDTTKANDADVYKKTETYTKKEVDELIKNLINNAPAALDTLGEIADKLKDQDDAVASLLLTIIQEIDNRKAADLDIRNIIENYVLNHNVDIDALYRAIEAEATRAKGQESSLDSKIEAETNRAKIAEEAIKNSIPTALKNPYSLSWTGYSTGSYDGSVGASFQIPNNTNQLINGADFITNSEASQKVKDEADRAKSEEKRIESLIPTIPGSIKNPFALSWSGYSVGSYDGSSGSSFIIPNNTNLLINGAGFITSAEAETVVNNLHNEIISLINNINSSITNINNAINTINQKIDNIEQTINNILQNLQQEINNRIEGDQNINNQITNITNKISALEGLWKLSGGYVTTTYPAKAAGYYDTTI